MIYENNTLTPDEGLVLTDGKHYSRKVYLAINASPDDWWEVPESTMPKAVTDREALNIITGKNDESAGNRVPQKD